MSIAERIVEKMNVVSFNSNENNEVGDMYPTEQDYIETIAYNLNHGWDYTLNYKPFSINELNFITELKNSMK